MLYHFNIGVEAGWSVRRQSSLGRQRYGMLPAGLTMIFGIKPSSLPARIYLFVTPLNTNQIFDPNFFGFKNKKARQTPMGITTASIPRKRVLNFI